MLYELAPVGNSIALRGAAKDDDLAARFQPFSASFYGSGTAALAAAVMAAIRRKPVAAPEVIVPAYTCPDVVSAICYAGARAVLADLDGLRPWMNLGQVESQIGPRTVAIVAVNFLGIPERRTALQQLAHQAGAILIEDSAQSFPVDDADRHALAGDFVILSFGRGKPVSLLGGGAVLSRRSELAELLPRSRGSYADQRSEWRFWVRAVAYNLLRNPRLYWALRAMPFLRLGQTRYKPLEALEPEPVAIRGFLLQNLDQYHALVQPAPGWIRDMLTDLRSVGVIDVASECDPGRRVRLLRYPVLIAGAGRRDAVFQALQRAGLGASRMYCAPLPRITGMAQAASIGGVFPGAQAFADALLTLPTHAQVRRQDVVRTHDVIIEALRGNRAMPQTATGAESDEASAPPVIEPTDSGGMPR